MELLTSSKCASRRAVLCLLVISLIATEPAFLADASGKTITEAQVSELHAALVLKIAMFVHWPDEALALSDETITLGVVGSDAVFHSFERLADKKIKDRKIQLEFFQEPEQLPTSEILFLSKSHTSEVKSWLGVLTIGDSPHFNAQGGMIKLSIENGRTKFTINLEAAEEAGIFFSSKLLKVATIYKGDAQ